MKAKEINSPYRNFLKAKITLDRQNTEIKQVFKQRVENNAGSSKGKDTEEWLHEYFIIFNSYRCDR
ncbi:MAG: hypothetical protein ACM34O_06685 [Ignavibacteria bacterium]